MSKTFICSFHNSPLEKTIEVPKDNCKTLSDLQDALADDLELTKNQFEIIDPPEKFTSKKENKIEIKIKNICKDVIFRFPKKRKILIEKCNEMELQELMDNIKKQGIYISRRCLLRYLQFNLFGMEIPLDDYCFSCVPKGKIVKVEMSGNVVILEYRDVQFILSENETVKSAIKLIQQKLEKCQEIYLTDILHEKLDQDMKLRTKDNKNYLVEAKQKFSFTSLSGEKSSKKMDFLSTVGEAKQHLASTNSFEIELSPDDIVIMDQKQKKIKEKEKTLITLINDKNNQIFYDIPKLNEKIKKDEEERKKKEAEEAEKAEKEKEKEKERKKKAAAAAAAAEEKERKEKDADSAKMQEELKMKREKNKLKKEKLMASEKSKSLQISFIFEDNEKFNFGSEILFSQTIKEIKEMIASLYKIENDITIKYKVKSSYVFCDDDEKIEDLKKFLIQKEKLYVYIDETSTKKKNAEKNKKGSKKESNDDDANEEEEEDFSKQISANLLKILKKKKNDNQKREEEKRKRKDEEERQRIEEERRQKEEEERRIKEQKERKRQIAEEKRRRKEAERKKEEEKRKKMEEEEKKKKEQEEEEERRQKKAVKKIKPPVKVIRSKNEEEEEKEDKSERRKHKKGLKKEEELKKDDEEEEEEEVDLNKPLNQYEFKKLQKELNKKKDDDDDNEEEDEAGLNKRLDQNELKKLNKELNKMKELKKEKELKKDDDDDDEEEDLSKPLYPRKSGDKKGTNVDFNKKGKSDTKKTSNKDIKKKEETVKAGDKNKEISGTKPTVNPKKDGKPKDGDTAKDIEKTKKDDKPKDGEKAEGIKKPKKTASNKLRESFKPKPKPIPNETFKFMFRYKNKIRFLTLDCESLLASHEEEVKDLYKIAKDNELDFFVVHYEDEDYEPIDAKNTKMKNFKDDTIGVDIRLKSPEEYLNKTMRSKSTKGKGDVTMITYFYRTNLEDEEEKLQRIELEETAKVIDMKKTIQKIKKVRSLSSIKILFVGKDLLDDIVLESLKLGSSELYVYIRPERDYFCVTAAALHITLNQSKVDDDNDDDDDSSSSS